MIYYWDRSVDKPPDEIVSTDQAEQVGDFAAHQIPVALKHLEWRCQVLYRGRLNW